MGLSDENTKASFLFNATQTVSTGLTKIDVLKAYKSFEVEKWFRALLVDGVRIRSVSASAAKFLLGALSIPILKHLLLFLVTLAFVFDKLFKQMASNPVCFRLIVVCVFSFLFLVSAASLISLLSAG
jgi:hypothetical protein